MEKFAVDLDRVLDEFEYNEDCAEQMARRDRRQYESYSSEEIAHSKSPICSHGELQDEELRESKSLPTEYPTRIVNKDSLLNKKIDDRLLHYDVEQRNLNESHPKRHSSKYPNINKTNDALDESRNSLHSKLNVNRVFSCLNEYINTGSVSFHINKSNYGYCEENQTDPVNNSSPPRCTDDTSISQSSETRRNENQSTEQIACNKSSQQQSSQQYVPCILGHQYDMNNEANDEELLRKTLECLYWQGDADVRSVSPGEESGSQVEVLKAGEILEENSRGESKNEFIPSNELSQQGPCSVEQNKNSEDTIKIEEFKDVLSNMPTKKDSENINRLEPSVFPVVYEDEEFSDEFLNMYLNSLESCDTYFSLDRIANEGTADIDVKKRLECDIHTNPISPTLSDLPSPTYTYSSSSDILVTECTLSTTAQNISSEVHASESSTPDVGFHNIVPCTIPDLDFSISPGGGNTTSIATTSSSCSIVTVTAATNPIVSSVTTFPSAPTAIAVSVATVTSTNSAPAAATPATSATTSTAVTTSTASTTTTASATAATDTAATTNATAAGTIVTVYTAPDVTATTTAAAADTTTTTNTSIASSNATNYTISSSSSSSAAAAAATTTTTTTTTTASSSSRSVTTFVAPFPTTNTANTNNNNNLSITAASTTVITGITSTTPTTTATATATATASTTTTATNTNTTTMAAATTTGAAAANAADTIPQPISATTTTTTTTTAAAAPTTTITAAAATTITADSAAAVPPTNNNTSSTAIVGTTETDAATTCHSTTSAITTSNNTANMTTSTTNTITTKTTINANITTTSTTTTAAAATTTTAASTTSTAASTTSTAASTTSTAGSTISTAGSTTSTAASTTSTATTTTAATTTTTTAAATTTTSTTTSSATTSSAASISTTVGTSNTIDANFKNFDDTPATFDSSKGSAVESVCTNSATVSVLNMNDTSVAPMATSYLSSIPLVESADNLHNTSVLNALENCSATTCNVRDVEVSEPSTSSVSTELCVRPTGDTSANHAYPPSSNISHHTFEDSSCLSLENCSGGTSVKNQPENAKKESKHLLRDRPSESVTDPFVEKMDTAADGLGLTLESGVSSTAGDDHVLSSPDTSEASSSELTLQHILASEVETSSNEVGCTSDEHSKLGRIPPMWVPDDKAPTCMLCCCKFTVLKRRHHCRACGKVFCSKCCCMKYRLDYLNYAEVRVCLLCHDILVRDADEENDSLKGLSDASSNNSNGVTSAGRKPNPNNPMEYCSTIPPLEQAANALSHPVPSVLVPVGVLKREGSARLKSDVAKQVIFSDGIRPGGDLTEVETSSEPRVLRQTDVTVKRVSNLSGLLYSTVRLSRSFDVKAKSFISNDGLPPLAVMDKGNLNLEDIPFRNMPHFLASLKCETNPPAVFALNKNLFVKVKILNLDCCVNRVCWCFSTEGMSCVSQDEIVIILECLPEDNSVPTDIFHFLNSLYHDATKGILISEMGHTIFKNSLFLGSSDHGGFLYIRPSFQCLHKIILPSAPYLVGILIHRWEIPWAKLFPIRLMLRLGAEFRYYPCMLVSIQQREPVYCEIGHTIMNLLADFRNMSYTLPSIPGMVIHMEDKHTSILLPKNRYDQVSRALNNSNDHVLALAANFSLDADSHLVCIQSPSDDSYHTQAINIHNKPRKVTGASFVVFNGALKISSNLLAKSTIVEDGLMVQITPDMIQELRSSLHKMKNFIVRCGPSSATAPDELVEITWIEEDRNFNIGVRSIIDGFVLDGVPSIRVHNGSDFMGKTRFIRWTEVFILQPGNVGDGMIVASDTIDVSHIAESLAAATCMALCDFLDLLAQSGFTRLAVRANIHQENVGYSVGSRGEKLPPIYMKSLDSTLVPVLHNTASAISNSSPIVLELIFHIMLQ